ncbi:MAG TPA: nucleotidyltransferase domain-containing protein [Caldimonas sp.]|nr:nucleotidyltransferase domain-containing protein [Caldimonas sp.]
MIPESVRTEIIARIRRAEREHEVVVLLAVESGSRAWGFESPNSDYDARFVYAHRPDWYLSVDVEGKRDVIEYPIVDDIDLNGWDVRKALRLLARSNPTLVEWVQSPIIYLESGSFASRVRSLLPEVYSCARGIYHYRSMARSNDRGYLKADRVPLKKYFYVLRPLLSVRWLERYRTPAPIEFEKLLHLIDDEPALLADVRNLLARKRAAPETGLEPPVGSIHAFIERELERLDGVSMTASRSAATESLDEVFRSAIREASD